MKRTCKFLSLTLIVVLLLSATALGAGTEKGTVTVVEGVGATATFDATNPDIIHVTVSSANLVAGNQYVVLMVKSQDGEAYTIDSDSILYIDQTAATADGDRGTVSFDVYPSSIQNSVILIAGAKDGLLKVAIVKGTITLGDVNQDSFIDAFDALQILRYISKLTTLEPNSLAAADVNGDTYVDAFDALAILRYKAGLIDRLPAE